MGGVWPVLVLAVAGVLTGGAYSLYKQGAGKLAVGLVGVLALIAGVAGFMWLLPES